jgi:hypothetical protein
MAKPDTHPVAGKALFEVDTPRGRRPFVPPSPEPADRPKDDEGNPLRDNPDNPRGRPSLSLPQQATPILSEQGVLAPEDLEDPDKVNEIMLQDGLAPDNPLNPRGTPDYVVEGDEAPPTNETDTRRQAQAADHG